MQANRDEAVKCLNIARRALRDGDKGKAKRFAEKAGRLGGAAVADQVASVLGEIESAPKENGASSSRQNGTSERENLRRRESAKRKKVICLYHCLRHFLGFRSTPTHV